MNSFRILTVCFPLFAASACAGDWSRLPPSGLFDEIRVELDTRHFYEVAASRESLAIYALENKDIIPLSEAEAKWYTGHYYHLEAGRKAYLVRALYGQAGTGSYSVYYASGDIWVFHGSLGSPALNQSALVVNLDFKPKVVYVSRSIAK